MINKKKFLCFFLKLFIDFSLFCLKRKNINIDINNDMNNNKNNINEFNTLYKFLLHKKQIEQNKK